MITIGEKEFRNLEEQVEKNKTDILYILEEAGVLNEFGIKVVGQVDSSSSLPDASSYEGEYGDAYAVGTAPPYELYIFTRASGTHPEDFWFDIGQFPTPSTVPGPAGATGPTGPTGARGSKWTSSTNLPGEGAGTPGVAGDQYLYVGSDTSYNGNVYQYGTGGWSLQGNIRGPQGIQGIQGPVGPTGPKGDVGPQGGTGPAGQSFQIVGILSTSSQLPQPSTVPDNYAYLIGSTGNYDLYVQVVGENEWVNVGKVEGVVGPQGPVGPTGPTGATGPQGPGFNYVGAWVSGSNEYHPDDVVTYEGVAYVCYLTVTNSSVPPSQDPQHWEKFIEVPGGGEAVVLSGNTGTLTEEQYNKLYPYVGNYIVCNNEYYYFADDMSSAGYLVFTHIGYLSRSQIFMKFITIMMSTKHWSNAVQQIVDQPQIYVHNITVAAKVSLTEGDYNVYFSFMFTDTSDSDVSSGDLFDRLYQTQAFNRDDPIQYPCSGVACYQDGSEAIFNFYSMAIGTQSDPSVTLYGVAFDPTNSTYEQFQLYITQEQIDTPDMSVYDNYYPIQNQP